MPAFAYDRIEDRNKDGMNEIVAVTWNDCVAWICDSADAPIWEELLKEQGIKTVHVVPEGQFMDQIRKSLGLN